MRRFFGGSPLVSTSKSTIQARPPHFLSSSNAHPVIYLPIPDPSSLGLILHWMYHGSMKHIEFALDDGIVTWEGLARNVEYLDIRDDMRQFLGNWYALRHSLCDESDSSDTSDSEEDEIFSPAVSPILDPDTDADVEDEDESDDESDECTPRRDPKKMAAVSRLLARSGPLRVSVR